MSVRHLLDVTDLTPGELRTVLNTAAQPADSLGRPLAGLGVALIFEKPSTRTRHSTEMAVVQLGGHPIYTNGVEIGLGTREPVSDVTRVLQGYHRVLGARVVEHTTLEEMVAVAEVPVVNLLSDRSHPLQALADAMTMEQAVGPLAGRAVAWIGDYNNVARSLGEAVIALGADMRLACPPGFEADDAELERLSLLGDGSVEQTGRPVDAVAGAAAVHTDTWVSMGQEDDAAARRRAFEGYSVDERLLAGAAHDAVFLHCLPAYRGMEVSAGVIDGPRSVVVQQAHNRVHATRAALALLLEPNGRR